MREPVRLGRTRLSDGRSLGWAEWGPVEGTPVLLCPGAATSRRLGFAGDLVGALNVRLVSVDRPGLGVSDPLPGRSLADWARDIRHFVRVQQLTGPAVVGFSTGAPFALACAEAGVVTGTALVSGTDELAHPGLSPLLSPQVRELVRRADEDPVGAEGALAGSGGPDALWDVIIGASPETDRETYTEPSFQRALRQALVEGFAQGSDGYAHDAVLTMTRWPFDPGDVTVPVDLWYGENDTSPTHSPDLGASLQHRMPAAHRHVVPDVGASLLWTHSEAILRCLLGRME